MSLLKFCLCLGRPPQPLRPLFPPRIMSGSSALSAASLLCAMAERVRPETNLLFGRVRIFTPAPMPRSSRPVPFGSRRSLGIASAAESARCTICHAPLADVPESHLASTANPTEGVSCESCHNGAGAWLRGHTRPDWTYSERIHAGLRDLRSAYVRANTCVACHQVLDPALLKAGQS